MRIPLSIIHQLLDEVRQKEDNTDERWYFTTKLGNVHKITYSNDGMDDAAVFDFELNPGD